VVLNNTLAVYGHILAVGGADQVVKLLICRVLEAAKDDKALRVIACRHLAFGWTLRKTQIKLELGSCLNEVERCDVVDVSHNLSDKF